MNAIPPPGLAERPVRFDDGLGPLRSILPLLSEMAATADASADSAPGLETLRGAGLLKAPLGLDEGGAGLLDPDRWLYLYDLLRLLGSADLSLARLMEGHANAVALVNRYGSPAQRSDLAAAVRDGAMSGVWAADDAQGLRAEHTAGGLRLAGRKVYASGAGHLARPLVTAATPDGPILIRLDLSLGARTDVSTWTASGMRASATGVVDLDGVIVPLHQQVGRPGDFLRQPHLSGGAWRFCAAHLGAAERLVDLFRAHLVARGRDGDPYQRQRVTQCVLAVGSAAAWIRKAARRVATGEDRQPDEVVALTNFARVATERAGLDVIEAVQRGVGLGGFLRPGPVERIARDLATYLRQPVPDLAMADAARVVLASSCPTGELWRVP